MFKRIQRVNKALDKRARKGEMVEDEGPRELALDEDTESESEDSSASSKSSRSASEPGAEAENDVDSTSEAGSDDDDDDEDSSEERSELDHSEAASSKRQRRADVDDPILRPSIDKALAEPLYVKPDAIEVNGSKHRSCYICPVALLKTQKMAETHILSGSHQRRLKRVKARIEKLSDDEKQDPKEGGLDIVSVVEQVDEAVLQRQERELKQKKDDKSRKKYANKKKKADLQKKRAAAAAAAATAVEKNGNKDEAKVAKDSKGDKKRKRANGAESSS